MSKNLEDLQNVKKLFDYYFEDWANKNLIEILDETFDAWRLQTNSEDGKLHIHIKLNDTEEYGEDLDTFLEYQVLGIKFLQSMGLSPEEGYEMESLLEVLSDYIMVYSLNE